ncbi:cupin domain-containing protein [Variovorax dokdonensis]|uniref:Cupin domain-containing protein n=1 Tax=Variovorax dokdonensis TaxID=344883 RepID=A0ABT7N653_9BURK|nr:cupin domain-containing protein [Variovorax dokdonensis]MDM0043401.1 cupin domain-containing protein [Variovorax dokdonensis]
MKKGSKYLKAVALAAAVGIGVACLDVWLFVANSAPPSAISIHQGMTALEIPPEWIRSGNPRFKVVEIARSSNERHIVGLWQCEGPTTFEWQFSLDETVHLLEGEVRVDYLGKSFTLRPGHSATFHAGTRAVWHIPDRAKKVFSLEHPGKLGLLWRRVVTASN